MSESAFYLPQPHGADADGDGAEPFLATEATRGPWDPGAQHAGPVAALVGRALERCEPRADARIARVTLEILGPVPIGPVATSARVLRGGRSVELLEAELSGERGALVRARAWRIRTTRLDGVQAPPRAPLEQLPGPQDGEPWTFGLPGAGGVGWHTSVEWRFVRGAFQLPGPATGWMRMRIPLVAGEQPSPLTRLLCAADAGNGISAELDWRRYLFINTELTVHLHRLPVGEWVALESRTSTEPDGIGMAESALHDERGPIGRAAQALLLGAR